MTHSTWAVRGARERSQTDRYRALLDAAARVFAERGYSNTTVAAITAEAGVSRATLYVYFASKEEIFHALATRVRDDFLTAQEPDVEPDEPRTMLRTTIESFAAAIRAAGPLLRLIEERGAVDPRLAPLAEEIAQRPIRRFTRYLERQLDLGTVTAVVPPRIVAEAVGYTLTRGSLDRLCDAPAVFAEYVGQIQTLAESLLGLRRQ
ncbi:TetR/AcrR family transcriptional regulator [Nocardia arizonensis]|uniref:TetR/AcrR family transcriptional regulator n=1 Tax=Nocardia arizonensis TaxID=1141647 RepID=UPI00138F8C76|nr:TetR/AcrR family transcriptional regulator [Nocardia arizonensis]